MFRNSALDRLALAIVAAIGQVFAILPVAAPWETFRFGAAAPPAIDFGGLASALFAHRMGGSNCDWSPQERKAPASPARRMISG